MTILPPRPVSADIGEAIEHARTLVAGFAPFDIVAGEVEMFPSTDVIYIGIKQGEAELREVNRRSEPGARCLFRSRFRTTLTSLSRRTCRRIGSSRFTNCARKRWAAFPHSRRIRAERACFVQSTVACTWVDLAEFKLTGVPVG